MRAMSKFAWVHNWEAKDIGQRLSPEHIVEAKDICTECAPKYCSTVWAVCVRAVAERGK